MIDRHHLGVSGNMGFASATSMGISRLYNGGVNLTARFARRRLRPRRYLAGHVYG
jgi:hypothetical protein